MRGDVRKHAMRSDCGVVLFRSGTSTWCVLTKGRALYGRRSSESRGEGLWVIEWDAGKDPWNETKGEQERKQRFEIPPPPPACRQQEIGLILVLKSNVMGIKIAKKSK